VNFLNPTILFAAFASLVPLIIHLFSRRRVKMIEFSSLKHLKAMQKRQVRRLRIRQLLLLLLRMLIILATVLAFARPTTEGGNLGSHASVSAVILFDNSASMNRYVTDGALFEIGRQQVEQILSTFSDADEVCLLTMNSAASEEAEPKFSSVAVASEMLSRLQPGYRRADLISALDKAEKLLDGAVNVNREVYLITDRQRNSLPNLEDVNLPNGRFYISELPVEHSHNCTITGVNFGGQLLIPGHDFEIIATIRNNGSTDAEDVIASLYMDESRVAQSNFAVASNQESTVRFNRAVSQGGYHSGYIEISDDQLMTDNRYYFSFYIPEQFNVLVISGDDAAQFISMALTPAPTVNQYWSVKSASPDDLGTISYFDYDVLILAAAPPLSEVGQRRLSTFRRSGRSLFITYGARTDIDSFNRHWSSLTGVTFDEAMKTNVSRAGYYTLETVDPEHPIFSVFNFVENRPPEIKFYSLPRLHVDGTARVLARFSGDRPAMIEKSGNGGRVITFAGPVSPEYSDLAGHAFFVPLVSRVAEYLAADLSNYELELFCDAAITRSIALNGSIDGTLELTTPDGSSYQLVPRDEEGNLVVQPKPTTTPGIYRISHQGREVDRFAINVQPNEGNLEAVDVDGLATALGAGTYYTIPTTGEITAAIAELRFGKELWQLFLWLAAIMLAAEMLLARSAASEE